MTSAPERLRLDAGLARGDAFEFFVDDAPVRAFRGETIAAALLAHGRRTLRLTAKSAQPRGYYCGMGVCWECVMWVDGKGAVQSCRVAAESGLSVRTFVGHSIARREQA